MTKDRHRPSNTPNSVTNKARQRRSESLRRGNAAEDFACTVLRRHGLDIKQRNYRCKVGEIDIVAQDGCTLVFVEVRYRHRASFGSGAETIDRRKQQKLLRAANHYIQCFAERRPCRFDVVQLQPNARGAGYDTEWIKNAIQESW